MTRLEMWSALEAGGWGCRPAPPLALRGREPAWDLRGDAPETRNFYLRPGRLPLPSAPYLRALLSRDLLLSKGVHLLPHFRRADFYTRVLRYGQALVAAPSPAALQDDEEVLRPLPLSDAPGEATRPARAPLKLGPFGQRYKRRRRAARGCCMT